MRKSWAQKSWLWDGELFNALFLATKNKYCLVINEYELKAEKNVNKRCDNAKSLLKWKENFDTLWWKEMSAYFPLSWKK